MSLSRRALCGSLIFAGALGCKPKAEKKPITGYWDSTFPGPNGTSVPSVHYFDGDEKVQIRLIQGPNLYLEMQGYYKYTGTLLNLTINSIKDESGVKRDISAAMLKGQTMSCKVEDNQITLTERGSGKVFLLKRRKQ
jgi:hypothetical protein